MTQLPKTIRFPNSSICLLRLLASCSTHTQQAAGRCVTKERYLSAQRGPGPKGAGIALAFVAKVERTADRNPLVPEAGSSQVAAL
jgi:hypothetical protein